MSKSALFRVAFHNQGKIYELYCTGVVSSGLFGFIELSGLVFDGADAVVVDPTEERIREEFEDVEVLHVPLQAVMRVEQVCRKGQAVIRDRKSGEKVTPFPLNPAGR